ncbi:MAG: winged helix-turn-helix domain-containing protein [Candidatus Thiodiazotropha endolucinida]
MRFLFDEFELDTERFELSLNGHALNVEPKIFDLLALLVQHPEQLFTREQLIEQVWHGRLVSDTTISTCVKGARKALNDSGSAQTYIRTVRGRGFCFVGNVRRQDEQQTPTAVSDKPAVHNRSREHNTPTLAVLPFKSLTDDADATTLASALGNDISAILTRLPLLRVQNRTQPSSDSVYSPAVRELYETLGIDFVVDARVQRTEDRFRIAIELTDARSGFQLWSEQFSIPGPLSTAIDDAMITIIAKLEPQLNRSIYERVTSDKDSPPNARQLFLEANSLLALRGWHHDTFVTAAELLRRSHTLDPGFALASANLALVLGLGDRFGVIGDTHNTRSEAIDAVEQAITLDGTDSTVLGYTGCALADLGFLTRALPMLHNATEINTANAQAWAALGSAYLVEGDVEQAVRHLRHGIEISPLDSRLSIWGAFLALALLARNDQDEALQQGMLACRRDDRSYIPRVILATIHLARNEPGPASEMLQEALRIKPDLNNKQITALVGRRANAGLAHLRPRVLNAD